MLDDECPLKGKQSGDKYGETENRGVRNWKWTVPDRKPSFADVTSAHRAWEDQFVPASLLDVDPRCI